MKRIPAAHTLYPSLRPADAIDARDPDEALAWLSCDDPLQQLLLR
jgi:hypothetical protein